MKAGSSFDTIRSLGSMLPSDLLERVASGDKNLEGLRPEDYHLHGERINEATSRAWNRLSALWPRFRASVEVLHEDQPTTAITRERWLLPLFDELGFGRLQPLKQAAVVDRKTYPISHSWGQVPIHLLGTGIELDKRTKGTVGAATQSPHSMVQDFLNSSDDHLWGFVSNGQTLRILRDNISMTRQAYVEFDLEGMMEGEAYSDFTLLWLLCHQSRVEGDRPELCWLEKWSQQAQQDGTRALDSLRSGVEEAITALGQGFLAYRGNHTLTQKLRSGELNTQDYYRQLLRLVYRLLFLLVVEARDLLHQPDSTPNARSMYEKYYSFTRLRDIAEKKKGSRHPDLWRTARLVFTKLCSDDGCPELGLPALGSFLWSSEAMPDLETSDISNNHLLDAVRQLALLTEKQGYRRIDFRNLGSEELGSVYESLLELQPEINTETSDFSLKTLAGHERKSTGSYYTPTSLINELLNSALEPVMDQRIEQGRRNGPDGAEQALLSIKVCDPASGSGHFLIAAAHRMAKRLAAIRTGEDEPAPEPYRHALRDVISHCIYGVDINPMAVELCKVSLWLEALEPGKPLSFLDHHIKCGNSLLGTTPELIKDGIPDGAFKPITGDDKKVCSKLKMANKQERKGQMRLLFDDVGTFEDNIRTIALQVAEIDNQSEENVLELKQKESRYNALETSRQLRDAKLVADAWCSAFVWNKTDGVIQFITTDTIRRLQGQADTVPTDIKDEVQRLAGMYKFFHWHLEYPDVFTGDDPGFDVVLGNPPWERVKLQEKEFFAGRSERIANAPNAAARRRLIKGLKESDPELFRAFQDTKRMAEGESSLLRESGHFPLCGRGDVNTYTVFAELKRSLISGRGRVGCIVPSGIATDDTTKYFFQDLVERSALVSYQAFINEARLFPHIDHRVQFCLLVIGGVDCNIQLADLLFGAYTTTDLSESERHFSMSSDEFRLLNPNTMTCPIFRSKKDAELTKYIYRRIPVLINENDPENGNPWGIKFLRMFDMSNDSILFRTREQLEDQGWILNGNVFERGEEKYLPLYEGKMFWQYDHRFGTYEGQTEAQARQGKLPELTDEQHEDECHLTLPRYWVHEDKVAARLEGLGKPQFLLAFRDVTSSVVARTAVFAILPLYAVNHKAPIMFHGGQQAATCILLACLNSFIFDYCTRQKLGGSSLGYFILKQLPVVPHSILKQVCPWNTGIDLSSWVMSRIIELTRTSVDMLLGAELNGIDSGKLYTWNRKRRRILRAELDAAMLHIYFGVPERWKVEGSNEVLEFFPTARDAVSHVLDHFRIVRERDEAKHEEYRTKNTILEIYDRMSEAINSDTPYQTILDPPPGDPRVALRE
ncbi:MAG: hypothetical protein AVO35_10360 [Candidatus Aegiribacteria sp. MLS_C]|nr:MAG: hypothetical protein AVO35_10360 [Candidatus Aegiribacteria sp. MLS_C]